MIWKVGNKMAAKRTTPKVISAAPAKRMELSSSFSDLVWLVGLFISTKLLFRSNKPKTQHSKSQ
jgi:hypothetical protein